MNVVLRTCHRLSLVGLILLVTAFLLPIDVQAESAALSECDDCHGAAGVSQWSDIPTIAGISAPVHADALFSYGDGARPCAESTFRTGDTSRPPTDMCKIVAALSDAEIEAVAERYAALPFVPAKATVDPTLVAAGKRLYHDKCRACHRMDGADPADDASILKGQQMDYLRNSFTEYQSLSRQQPRKMAAAVDVLSKDDIEALVHFFASP